MKQYQHMDNQTAQNQAPQTPVATNPTHSSSPKYLTLILVALVAALLASGGTYLALKKSNTKPQNIVQITPSPTPTPDPSADWTRMNIDKLEIRIPTDWWSKLFNDSQSDSHALSINPTPLEMTNNVPPAFQITTLKNMTIEKAKKEMLPGIEKLKEESITVDKVTGVRLSDFADAKGNLLPVGSIVLLPYLDKLYIFQTLVKIEGHEKYFDQILSTFQFSN